MNPRLFSSSMRSAIAGETVLLVLACSPNTGQNPDEELGVYAGSSGGSPSNVPSYLPSTGGGGGGTTFTGIPSAASHGVGPDASCAAVTHAGENIVVTTEVPVTVEVTTQSPVALYLMQDRSGSMQEPYFPPPNKWDLAMAATQAFTTDPSSADLSVALQFFPGDSDACDGSGYDVPLVPMGKLPGNAAAINGAFAATQAYGSGTPIEAAIRGATRYCAGYQQQHAGEKCVAVLLTDGEPNGCNQDHAALAQIAADALAQSGVITFAVGMVGADFTLLDAIARAGGSDCTPGSPGSESCNVSGGGSSFTAALNTIRASVTTVQTHMETHTEVQTTKVDCEFQLPAPPAGESFDRNKVNIQFNSSSTASQKFLQVPTESECAAAGGGWHYDDAQSPTKIVLCTSTCGFVQSIADARIDVLFGCATEVAVIH